MKILALVTAIIVSFSMAAMAGDIMRKPVGPSDAKTGANKSANKSINKKAKKGINKNAGKNVNKSAGKKVDTKAGERDARF